MSNKFSNIKERILYLAEIQEGNKQNFCKKIGVTYGNFTGKNKETPISSTTIENILLNYPNTNLYWLITGEGEMLKNYAQEERIHSLNEPDFENYSAKDKEIAYLKNENRMLQEIIEGLKRENEILRILIPELNIKKNIG